MKTTAEKIAVMQACLPDYSNLEVMCMRSANPFWDKYHNVAFEPMWDWRNNDYRIKAPEPKTKEFTIWAHWIKENRPLYGSKDMFFEIENLSIHPSYKSTEILAVKPITFTITEGEGLEVSNG